MAAAFDNHWSCGTCTFLNHPAIGVCELCSTERLGFKSGPGLINLCDSQPDPDEKSSKHDVICIDEDSKSIDGDEIKVAPDPDSAEDDRDALDMLSLSSETDVDMSDAPPMISSSSAPKPLQEIARYLGDLCCVDVPPSFVKDIAKRVKEMLKMGSFDMDEDIEWIKKADRNIVVQAASDVLAESREFQDISNTSPAKLKENIGLRCRKCGISVQGAVLHPMEKCDHCYCSQCIREYTLSLVKDVKCNDIKCPFSQCSQDLSNSIIRECLMPNEYDEYMRACMFSFIEADSSVMECPNEKCTAIIDVVDPNEATPAKITVKSSDGQPISREAMRHYNRNRIRCRVCNTKFCKGCKRIPYHVGFTCEGFATYGAAQKCRFCQSEIKSENMAYPIRNSPALNSVCNERECLDRRAQSCAVTLPCGHACGGVVKEDVHLPCLQSDCKSHDVPQSGDDFCNICYVEGLEQAPCIKMKCGHIFHRHCCVEKLNKKWPSTRITFGFMKCPLCPEAIGHPSLANELRDLLRLRDKIKAKSVFRLKVDGLLKDKKLTDPASKWFGKPEEFAMNSYAYYNCFKCKKEYFGGRRDCEQNADAEGRPPEEFVCFDCADISVRACAKPDHREYHLYKCRFCCSPAVWFCWGTTHFCDPCHADRPWDRVKWGRNRFPQCPGPNVCKLGMEHAPNGSEKNCEQSLGCAMCQDESKRMADDQSRDREVEAKFEEPSVGSAFVPAPPPPPPAQRRSIFRRNSVRKSSVEPKRKRRFKPWVRS
eukprot:411745_1